MAQEGFPPTAVALMAPFRVMTTKVYSRMDNVGPTLRYVQYVCSRDQPSYLYSARNRITTMTREGEWEDLDRKFWVPNEEAGDDEDDQVDGVERFFDYLASSSEAGLKLDVG